MSVHRVDEAKRSAFFSDEFEIAATRTDVHRDDLNVEADVSQAELRVELAARLSERQLLRARPRGAELVDRRDERLIRAADQDAALAREGLSRQHRERLRIRLSTSGRAG